MANSNATRTTLNLGGNLNLDKNKAQVVTTNQFNEKNAPIYNGCLSPLYVNVEENVNGQYDEDGNLWTIRNGKLYKGDTVVSDNIFDSPYKREKLDYEVIWSRYQTFVEKNSHVVTEELVKVTLSGAEFKYKLDGEEKTIALPKGDTPTFRPLGAKNNEFYYAYCCITEIDNISKVAITLINANTQTICSFYIDTDTSHYAFCNICVPYNAGANQFSTNGQFCVSLCTREGSQIINPEVENIICIYDTNFICYKNKNYVFTYTNNIASTETKHNDIKNKFIFIPGSNIDDLNNFVTTTAQAEAFFIGKYNEEDTGKQSTDTIYLYGGIKVNSFSINSSSYTWNTNTDVDSQIPYTTPLMYVGNKILYYENSTSYKEFDKLTKKWISKNWANAFFNNIATKLIVIGNKVIHFASDGTFYMILNTDTMIWEKKEVSNYFYIITDGLWTDGKTVFYSYNDDQKYLDINANEWKNKNWNVPGGYKLRGANIKQFANGDFYHISIAAYTYKYNGNDIWESVTWGQSSGSSIPTNGSFIWVYKGETYSSSYTYSSTTLKNCKYNPINNTWEQVYFPSSFNPTGLSGKNFWTDGEYAYYSNVYSGTNNQYVWHGVELTCNIIVIQDNNQVVTTNDAERWFVDSGLTYADAEDSPVIASYTLYEGHYEQIVAVKKGEEIQTFIFSPNRALYNTGVIFTKGDSLESMDKDSIPSYGIGKTNRQLSNDVKYLGTGIILFNSNYITAIASGNGNLLSAWYDIGDKTPVFDNTDVYYVDSNGDSWKLTQGGTPYVKKIINNRYVLVASDGVYNVYDKVKGKLHNWTIAYNGNLKIGDDIPQTTTSNLTNGTCVSAEDMPSYKTMHIIGAAVNPFFEVTKIPFTGSIFAQMNIYGITPELIKNCLFNPSVQTVDVFCSTADESTTAIYNFSFVGTYNAKINDVDLVDMYYPTTTILTIPFYADIIQTYNAYDFLKIGNNGYPIIYSNNKIILAYFSLSFVEDLDNIFVIQNTAFGVCDNKILRLDYSGYTLSGTQFIADVTGLTFVGSTPKQAIFYSPTKRQLYNFMGDCVLTVLYDCGAIGEVITAQNAFLQNINYISLLASMEEADGTKQKLMFVGDSDMFAVSLEEFGITDRVERYTVTINNANASIIFSFFNSENENTVVMLRFDNKEGFTCIPVNIKTGYNGTGNEGVNVVSCWYIRLLNYNGESGDIMRIAEKVITDIGTSVQTREVNISAADFDPLTGYYYIRYQPQAQRGIGVSLELKTKFPIYEVIAEWQADTTQLSGRNV